MKLVMWRSQVRFLFWKLESEPVTALSFMHQKALNGLILARIHPLLRPFCRVIWRQV